MAGKTVVGITCGYYNSYALTSDGKVYAWGSNFSGQCGDGTTTTRPAPVAVSTSGVLSGKTVIAISGGNLNCLALTTEGKVYSWGDNTFGQDGDNTTTNRTTPVAVAGTAITGKTIVGIRGSIFYAGAAIDSNGQAYTWGDNAFGSLGDSTKTDRHVPVAVVTAGTPMAGLTFNSVCIGSSATVALGSDGNVYSWGSNNPNQLGDPSVGSRTVPGAVNTSGALSGVTANSASISDGTALVLGTDGNVYTWGENTFGNMGEVSTGSGVPIAISPGSDLAGKTIRVATSFNEHTYVLYGTGEPFVGVNPNDQTVAPGGTATFTASASGIPTPTVQWQVSTTGVGGTFTNITGNASATTTTLSVPNVTLAQNGYSYRAVFTNSAGTATSTAGTLATTFTTLLNFDLTNYGAKPAGIMQARDGFFYGTTTSSASNGSGTIFKFSPPSTLNNLVTFVASPTPTGGTPVGLIQGHGTDNNLYGACSTGGNVGVSEGWLFNVTTGGTLTDIHDFQGTNSLIKPLDNLVEADDGFLYGTTYYGGTSSGGGVFKTSTDGTTFSTLFSFSNAAGFGNAPTGGLVQASDHNLYGATQSSIYRITTAGAVTLVYTFPLGFFDYGCQSALIQGSDGLLYGTTLNLGSTDQGTLFKVTITSPFTLTTLVNFSSANGGGYSPIGRLMQASDGNFYGTCSAGGTMGYGTIFCLTPAGVYTTLYNFDKVHGANPQSPLIQGTDGKLYGVAPNGGTSGYGTIFSLDISALSSSAPAITNGPAPSTGSVGTLYSFNYSASGNPTPVFSGSGFPPGIGIGSTGLLSGTPTLAGIYPVTIQAANGVGSNASLNFNITIFNTFASWESTFFTPQQIQQADPNVIGPNANPSGDGTVNLLKYLFDISPTSAMSTTDRAALPKVGLDTTTTPGTTYLEITYRSNPLAGGITVNLQTTTNLVDQSTWQTVVPDLVKSAGTDPVTGDPLVELGIKLTTPEPTAQFIRLNVTSP